MRPSVSFWSLLPLVLTGCAITSTAPPTPQPGPALQGVVHGGQQPIVGAHIYLFAANTTGYGGNGIAPSTINASIPLLNATTTGLSDTVGAYVLTDANGQFSITNDYTCTPGQQVYLYSLGGQPTTGTTNSAAGLLAVLGSCPTGGTFAGTLSYLYVNEVSTIAAAYAMAGFASDATHVSSSGTTLAQTGIANAFANANQLYNLQGSVGGIARATTPAGNGTVPQATIDTLANILAACINTNGTITGPTNPTACYTLFNNAQSSGSSGTLPTDTATAAINIAHNPGSNITALYSLPGTSAPFGSALSGQPNDFTIGLSFTGGGLNDGYSIAIDGSGNAWIQNNGGLAVTEYSSVGAALSPSSGYTGGGLSSPSCIAIDGSGNVWIANDFTVPATLSEFSNSGVAISPSTGYTGGGLSYPAGIAVDASGDVWVANFNGYQDSLSKFSTSGTAISSSSAYKGGGLSDDLALAIDGSGNVWAANFSGTENAISKFSNSGSPISSSSGYTGGGLDEPFSIAIDNSENIWVANHNGDRVSKFNKSGSAISSSSGYTGGGSNNYLAIAVDGSGNAWIANLGGSVFELSNSGAAVATFTEYAGAGPQSIAIDGSGNVWTANINAGVINEIIGTATPVVTPLVDNLISPYSAPASKP